MPELATTGPTVPAGAPARRSLRILVHDYSGHPFQVQLSRALAARGHEVLHVHCDSYRTGKGAVSPRPGDPAGFTVEALGLGRRFERYRVARRLGQELRYGRSFSARAARFAPDVVLSSNDPLFAKARMASWCRRSSTPWVFWLQDLYSLAMAGYAAARWGGPGRLLGRGFQALERRLLHEAAEVVAISHDFLALLGRWGVDPRRCHVVENWAPLAELPTRPRDNPWARSHGLAGRPVVLYSGTLGLKHDPSLLSRLARRVHDQGAAVVVVSEGAGAAWLHRERERGGLDNLVVLGYQPFEDLPDVMGTADVVVALLDPAAGAFSVPSKVLTYLCAGRPVVGAIPAANLAARTIERAGAGLVVPPDDGDALLEAVAGLLEDPGRRARLGDRGRRYAEATFALAGIVERFEAILARAASSGPRTASSGSQPGRWHGGAMG